jgi:HD-GYP domain-containing protein (c-di-GMP phosphodiesterase class II)
MPAEDRTTLIDLDALRLGMVVHLDLSWLEHPFPRSRFELTSQEQIGILRALGLRQVRVVSSMPVPVSPQPREGGERVVDASPAPAPDPAVAARLERLAEERASLQRSEKQFARAAAAWKTVWHGVLADPRQAVQHSRELVGTLMKELTECESAHIRLLSESAGDLASQHSVNVTVLSLMLGRAMGIEGGDLEDIGLGALLHDLGKLELPAAVREHDDHHNHHQAQLYRDHVAHGIRLGVRMGLGSSALMVIAQHHEAADGSGFPQQLEGDRICLGARIVALINRYDGLCNPSRPGLAMTPHEALTQLYAQQRHRHDANVMNGFVRLLGVYPPGSVIQLSDGRHAMVVAVNPDSPLRPRIIVHEPSQPREDALPLDLRKERALSIRRSLHPQHLPRAALDYLSPRQRMCYFFERGVSADGSEAAA